MVLLGSRDARDVYDELLSLAVDYAVTTRASDRIRVLTPLSDPEGRTERLDTVLAAREAWTDLDGDARAGGGGAPVRLARTDYDGTIESESGSPAPVPCLPLRTAEPAADRLGVKLSGRWFIRGLISQHLL